MSHARKLLPLFALVIVSLLASACSSLTASPTPSLQEMQLTAQAAAAMTLTAQAPSPTPVTPSPTPIPTIMTIEPVVIAPPSQAAPPQVIVPPVIPTQPVMIVQPAATDAKKKQDCSKSYISAGTEGARAPVEVVNKKGASITLSYYLELNAFGQCGSGSLSLDGDSKSLNLPVGCYYLYAWVTYDGKDQSFKGYSCLPKKGVTWLLFPDRMEEAPN
jgi:hypothetical protein